MFYLLLTFLSGILYLLPFFYPYTFYWTTFFFMFPLYVNISSYQKGGIAGTQFLLSGLFWSLTVFSVHLIWFWNLLYSSGSSLRIIFGLITIMHFSLIVILPFSVVLLLKRRKWLAMFLFSLTFGFSIYLVSYKSFLIFGRNEGYFLFDPILPFMTQLNRKNKNGEILPLCLTKLKDSPTGRAHQLSTLIAQESYNKKGCCMILLPESTFPYNLEEYSDFLPIWCDCHEDIHIIIGSHLHEGEKVYNCAYHIHNGKIVEKYRKKHLVPFFESIPRVFIGKIGEIFTQKNKTFSYPSLNNNDIFLINGEKYQLFICSELYQSAKPVQEGIPVLFIGNSSWFMAKYAKKLAELSVDYFSWWNDCEIISCVKKE